MIRDFARLDDQQLRHLVGDYICEMRDDSRLLMVFNSDSPSGANAWFDARDGRGQTAGYIGDLMRVWQHFDEIAASGTGSRRTVAIGQQVRCAMIIAAINTVATQIPPRLSLLLVQHGHWTPAQAIAYAQRKTPGDHFSVLVETLRLEPASSPLREELARQVLDAARPVADDVEQVAGVVGRLAESLQPSELSRLLPLVKRIRSDGVRAKALRALAEVAPPALLPDAVELAKQIQDPGSRSEALAACCARSPEGAQRAIFEECVDSASRSTDAFDAFTTLAILLPRNLALTLPESLPPELADDGDSWRFFDALYGYLVEEDDPAGVVRAVAAFPYGGSISSSLQRAAVELARQGRNGEALEAAKNVMESSRGKVLADIVDVSATLAIDDLLDAIRELDPAYRQEPLCALARRADERLATSLLELAQADPGHSTQTLALVAASLPEAIRDDAVAVAFRACGTDLEEFRYLAPVLPAELASQALKYLHQALVHHEFQLSGPEAFSAVVARLADLGETQQVVDVLPTLGDPGMRIATLTALAEHAPSELPSNIWQALTPPEVLDARLDLAALLVPKLPAETVTAVVALTHSVWSRLERARRLLVLASRLPTDQRSQIVTPVLSAIADLENTEPSDIVRLVEQALDCFPGREQDVLKAVYRIRDRASKLNALVSVAGRLDDFTSRSVWSAALKTANGYSASRARADALAWLSGHLPADLHSDLLDAAKAVSESGQTVVCLGAWVRTP